jgi:(2Fe-2S) ferredoxin
VLLRFQELFERHQLWGKVFLTKTHCLGPCQQGAVLVVYPEGTWYGRLTVEDVDEIVEKHLIGSEPVKRLELSAELWG